METKTLKRGVQAGLRGGCLKKGRSWNHLTNCDNLIIISRRCYTNLFFFALKINQINIY